jgi:hypothetical protein
MMCDLVERSDLLADLGDAVDPHVTQCSDCRARYAEYVRIAAALAQESTRPLPPLWKERTLARIRAGQIARRRRRALAAGFAIAAAAAFLIWTAIPRDPRMHVSFEGDGREWRGAQAHPGSVMLIAADAGSHRRFEVRIYREGRRLVARCPGDAAPACRVDGEAADVRYALTATGEYQVLLLISSSPLPEPTGDLDADSRAAKRSGASVAKREVVNVS